MEKLTAILIRPIVIFDVETTGLDTANDRIVELSILKLLTDGSKVIKTRRFNPGIAIGVEASKVHGIKNDDVKDEPLFTSLAKSIYEFIKGCDIGTFNGNRFDIPILAREFFRSGIDFSISEINVIDVRNLYTIQFPRDLSSAYKDYTGKELSGAHQAESDVSATAEILNEQINILSDIGDITKIAIQSSFGKQPIDCDGWFVYNDLGTEIIFNKGKHSGKPIKNNTDYLKWMAFSLTPPCLPDAKSIIDKYLL